MLSLITLVLVLAVGVSLGLLGSGGSILLIPTLVYVEGVDAADAVVISLAVVGCGSVFGAWLHHRGGNLDVRAASLFAASGSLGALAGARFTRWVPDTILMLLFGMLMLAVAIGMGRRPTGSPVRACSVFPCLLVGAGVGVLTGFLGVGGGFLLIPAMILVAGLDTHRAVASSLAVIAVNALAGFVGHVWAGAGLPPESVPALGAVLFGMIAGTRLGRRLSPKVLQRTFAAVVFLTGLFVVLASVQRLVAGNA